MKGTTQKQHKTIITREYEQNKQKMNKTEPKKSEPQRKVNEQRKEGGGKNITPSARQPSISRHREQSEEKKMANKSQEASISVNKRGRANTGGDIIGKKEITYQIIANSPYTIKDQKSGHITVVLQVDHSKTHEGNGRPREFALLVKMLDSQVGMTLKCKSTSVSAMNGIKPHISVTLKVEQARKFLQKLDAQKRATSTFYLGKATY